MKLRPAPHLGGYSLPCSANPAQEKFAVEHIWTNSKIDDENKMMVLGDPDRGKNGSRKRKRCDTNDDEYAHVEEEKSVIRSTEWNYAIQLVHCFVSLLPTGDGRASPIANRVSIRSV